MVTLKATNLDNRILELNFDSIPDRCPFCKTGIQPLVLTTYVDCREDDIDRGTKAWVIFKCPVNTCGNIFMGVYRHPGNYRIGSFFYGPKPIYPVFPDKKLFSEIIEDISPTFIQIYNQAFFAEQHNFLLIAGPGYRKALEYLIKDYAIKISDKSEDDNIRKMFLGQVIDNYIKDERIKGTAKRAAWLGNDETHYFRKWEEKDLESLKLLIELTIRWIESVELTKKSIEEMPEV